MKKKAQLSLIITVYFLIPATLFFSPIQGIAQDMLVLQRPVSLDKKGLDLKQAIEAVARQSDLNITIQGEKPPGTRDIFLSEMPVEKAIKQILKMYGVQNHAAVYFLENKIIMLFIAKTSGMTASLPDEDNVIKVMTPGEFAKLPPGKQDDCQPMTAEKFKQLPKGEADDITPMAAEKFKQLPKGEADDIRPMTAEKFKQLPKGEVDDITPMTAEKFKQLQNSN